MNLDLSGKRAVVCGSTQGIGLASAIELSQLGANICLVARNKEKLESALSQLDVSNGQKHDLVVVDFSNPTDVENAAKTYLDKVKQVDILVNNTGGPKGGLAIDAPVEEFLAAFNMHLVCNHHLVRVFSESMKTNGYGRVVNIISTSVKIPLKGLGVSNTIRGAVASWSKTLANELGAFNITVNNVLPGATNTVRLKSIIENKAAKTGDSIENVSKSMVSAIPMGRFAEAEEIANTVAFLCSPAASYINGVNIPVDGGRTGSM